MLSALVFLAAAGSPATAAPPAPRRSPAAVARAHVQAHEPEILREFAALLSLPNVASDTPNILKNAEHIRGLLEARGVTARLLDGASGPPAVYGERRTPGAKRTLVIYAHYDGQPVVESQWTSPPFSPVLLGAARPGGKPIDLAALAGPAPAEAYIYARSAGDDKAPIQALMSALDALSAARIPLSLNLKVFLEGEEEAGSAHLRAVLEREKERLAADAWLFCDGPVHQTRRPQIVFGVRGVTDVEVTLYGPSRPLHSGHYGNWAPNPAVELAQLVARLRDDQGRILVSGFYDDVRSPSAAEQRAVAEAPDVDGLLKRELLLGRTEGIDKGVSPRLEEALLRPALNVRGLQSGNVGERAQNAIPSDARLSIDFRLVPDQTPAKVRERFEAHLTGLGYTVVHETPSPDQRLTHPRLVKLAWGAGYPAYRASLDDPFAHALHAAIARAMGGPPVLLPTGGGSLPLYVFAEVLKVPIVTLPIANHDDNQHAVDENLRIQNLRDGIAIYAEVLAGLGAEWR
ncbi:MAG TPA: M20/M25/M40 family metallo-hydrolase [Vicinamibacteria bacterium]|nr:M20/M25/M40 family metallo-hydrolase [Vicinamibacteria bacterium]